MKTKFTLFTAAGLLFLIFGQAADAQILQTRSEVIETLGTPFSSGISEAGETYLYYKTPVRTKTSGTYNQRKVLFFKKFEDGNETCYKWQILEPSSEAKQNMLSFTRNLVQIGDMQWKDYGKGIVYTMELVKGVCSITAKYDEEVALAKVYKM